MAEKLATLSFSDGTPPIDLPMFEGSVGPDVIVRYLQVASRSS